MQKSRPRAPAPVRKISCRARVNSQHFTSERGAFGVMTAVLLPVILALCGLAIELGRIYNRKVELQTAADIIAFAAAAKLNGTSEGITAARSAAAQAASSLQYAYSASGFEWSEEAIRFSARPDSETWFDADAAAIPANAATMFFARIDTDKLEGEPGEIRTLLLRIFPSIPDSTQVRSLAVAGRSSVDVMPLAICAMSSVPASARGTELVEYGFRRGVSYNLMKLNPGSQTAGANYLVNPVAFPGSPGSSVRERMDVVRPFICTGTMAVPTLAGGKITVEPDFPLTSLYPQLNSRFNSYTAPCLSSTAPPDSNIKQFNYATVFTWMNSTPTAQSAESREYDGKLLTIADMPANVIPASTTGGMYGPLWVYARPVIKDSRYVEGAQEPATGYNRFTAADWQTLYTPGAQRVKTGQSYPSTPYTTTSHIEPPTGATGVAHRRVLNIPLLSCPVVAGGAAVSSADVVAIGRFFMTVSATETDVYAEFAGVAHPASLIGDVELYP
jgi:Flp pilus assembly protein TadG